jgi:predicted extracellular nuclease
LRSRVLALSLAALAILGGSSTAFASANGVVVSEFQFRGVDGNDEFVELLNTSTGPVNIGGWRLQGCAAASGAPDARATVPAGVTLAAGQRYLFVHTGGTATGDVSYGLGIADDGGARITLADTTTVVDGVGSSNGAVDECREGAGLAIPTSNGSNAFERKNGGAQDTNDNAADFDGPKAGNPQGSSTPPAPVAAKIREIQGLAHISPLNERQVKDVEGVVTALRTAGGRGFWMQDTAPDASPDTGEGIFVFTSAAPTVALGDAVRVAGRVSEFRPSNANNLTVTQIGSPTVTKLSSGNTVPAATVVGLGGRMPPVAIIDNDTSGSVETGPTTFDPDQDGIDFWESLEGMLVQVNDGAVVNETESFGEITLLPDNGMWATGTRTVHGGILPAPDYSDFNPERIAIDDEILRDRINPRPGRAMPIMDVGARILGAIVGPLDYTFANYKIQATATPAVIASPFGPETTQAPVDQEITIGTFNVENLDPGDGALFDRLAGQIVQNLRAPDLLGIEEVQDNGGAANDGVVDASQTWSMLIAAITRAGGPLYEYRQIDPVNNEDGGAPGANIRVGFLFRTDRGLSFIDRPGGTSTTATSVVATPSGPQLSFSPGRIDPSNPAFVATRKSLVGEFKARGKKLFVVVNHFSSKNDDQPLIGHNQPPTRFTEGPRHGQAGVVNRFADDILAVDSTANVVVLGDINDFEFSDTVDILEGDGELFSAIKTLPANERYSYVFEGNSQVLDQILLSGNLNGHFPYTYDVVHVNSEFSAQASDHEPSLVRIRLTGRPTPKP